MQVNYSNEKVQKQCTDLKYAKKLMSDKVATKLLKLINFIESADNLSSVTNYPRYNFHDLKGKNEGLYALDIDGRRSQYRLIVTFEADKDIVFSKSISIQDIIIKEVSKHYE